MEILFKREQTPGKMSRVNFKLWAKIEPGEDEQEIISRYKFDQAVLIEAVQPGLMRSAAMVAVGVFAVAFLLFAAIFGINAGLFLAIVTAFGAGYWYADSKRESIFVKDLLHGRHFKCESVIELARKEAWLATIVGFLRQVMESAKHWDGTETQSVEALPKDEARQVIIKGI